MRKASSLPPDWCFPDRVSRDLDDSSDSSPPDVSEALSESSVGLRCLTEIVDPPWEWVWDGMIPERALTLITGEPGVGKSRLTLGIVAAVTRGLRGPGDQGRWESKPALARVDAIPGEQRHGRHDSHGTNAHPDHPPSSDQDPRAGAVVVFSAAEAVVDLIRPRLIEAGAEMSRVFTLCGVAGAESDSSSPATTPAGESVEQTIEPAAMDSCPAVQAWSFQLTRDLPILERELSRLQNEGTRVRMIVIDPVDDLLATSSQRSVPQADIAKLAKLAARFRVAIVLVSNSSPSAMIRLDRRRTSAGTQALSAAARAVWMIVRDLDQDNRRLLMPIKIKSSHDRAGLAYCLENRVIVWDFERVTLKGDDYLAERAVVEQNPLAREYQYERDRAAAWLYERLSAGRVPSLVVQEDAELNEICYGTLRRAFRSLGCKTSKEKGKGRAGKWYWRLPGEGGFHRADAPRLPVNAANPANR